MTTPALPTYREPAFYGPTAPEPKPEAPPAPRDAAEIVEEGLRGAALLLAPTGLKGAAVDAIDAGLAWATQLGETDAEATARLGAVQGFEARVRAWVEGRLDGHARELDAIREAYRLPAGRPALEALRGALREARRLEAEVDALEGKIMAQVASMGFSVASELWAQVRADAAPPPGSLSAAFARREALEEARAELLARHPALGALDLDALPEDASDESMQAALRQGLDSAARDIEDVRERVRSDDLDPLDVGPGVQAVLRAMRIGDPPTAEQRYVLDHVEAHARNDRLVDTAVLAIGAGAAVASFVVGGPMAVAFFAGGAAAVSGVKAGFDLERSLDLYAAAKAGLRGESGIVDAEEAESRLKWAAADVVLSAADVGGAVKVARGVRAASRRALMQAETDIVKAAPRVRPSDPTQVVEAAPSPKRPAARRPAPAEPKPPASPPKPKAPRSTPPPAAASEAPTVHVRIMDEYGEAIGAERLQAALRRHDPQVAARAAEALDPERLIVALEELTEPQLRAAVNGGGRLSTEGLREALERLAPKPDLRPFDGPGIRIADLRPRLPNA